MTELTILKHPLVQAKLAVMRDKQTKPNIFRAMANELSELLCYEATKELAATETNIILVPILRAGNGMLEGALRLMPLAQVGHIGLYRDPKTAMVIEYYFKMPKDVSGKHVIIIDPMVATGNSAVAAVYRIKEARPASISLVCIVASKPGLSFLQQEHPHLRVYTAAVDEQLDAKNYIVPGLGDVGDRMFGTV